MIATRGLCSVSRSVKSRPATSGMPTVAKYVGATQLLFNWMPVPAPSIAKPLAYEQFVINPQVVTRGRLDARDSLYRGQQTIDERQHLLAGVAAAAGIDRRRDHVLRIEPGIDAREIGQRASEQHGGKYH